jgi:hypothetical protein
MAKELLMPSRPPPAGAAREVVGARRGTGSQS